MTSAVEQHRSAPGFGSSSPPKDCYLRSVIEIERCKKCEVHWVKFAVEKKSGDDWKEITDLTLARFTNQAVSVLVRDSSLGSVYDFGCYVFRKGG
jgi:hypothetical protein